MTISSIFISYRRSDSPDVTGRIYDRLVAYFSPTEVLRDVDSIPLSVPFPEFLSESLKRSKVVLVIIGQYWLNVLDSDGRRRIDDPNDFVRMEVKTALRLGIPTIPITVSHARIPEPSALPDDIQELALCNGLPVRPDPDFHRDMDRLIFKLIPLVGVPGTAIDPLKRDPRARVFYNNGWDGFNQLTDNDVLFYLKLNVSLEYVRYIEFLRQLKENAYHFERGIVARPELVLDPFEEGATLSVCFGSSIAGRQTEEEYDLYYRYYQPVLSSGVSLIKCDGNEEAMWVWSTQVPTTWLCSDRPFIQQNRIVKIRAMIEKWIGNHSAEIERIRSAV